MGAANTKSKTKIEAASAPPPSPAPKTAKLFKNGRSQAVRLPKEFRFEGTEVGIRRDAATGEVVLTPNAELRKNVPWEELFAKWDALGSPDDEPLERSNTPPVERDFFRSEQQEPVSAPARKLTLPELYAIFDRSDFPEGFFEREVSMPRELDLF